MQHPNHVAGFLDAVDGQYGPSGAPKPNIDAPTELQTWARAELVALAETAAWTEQANRQMDGLEVDGLQLVIAASHHRLLCGPCPDRSRTELYYQVAVDRLHALASNDPTWVQREETWARALDGLATSALRDMLKHAEGLLATPPAEWTPYQFGAANVWAQRLVCELAAREREEATV